MPSPTTLPARVDSSILARYLTAGEPVVLVKLVSVGNTSPYDFRDAKGSRSYVFRWDLKAGGHVLRVPLSLWQANKAQIAHDIMDQRRLPNAIVVTVEMPQPQGNLIKPLLDALISDPEFAWSWHCNIAMATYDAAGGRVDPAICNAGAAMFLSRLTDGAVDTAKHPAYAQTQGIETTSPEKGATDTANADDAQNVVGLSQDSQPTVALASEKTSEPQTQDAPSITDDKLAELAFDNAEQPKRIKALAAILGVEEDVLRAAIESPGSKVELAKAGWVRRKES